MNKKTLNCQNISAFNKNKYIRVALFLYFATFSFFALSIDLSAELSKESVNNKLKEKYEDISSISFGFSSLDNYNFKGAIKAKKGNKYILSMPGRDIVSNGKTIWNVATADKKVIISNYEDSGEGSLSIENLFFHFLDNYEPTELAKESSSKGKSQYVLTLNPSVSDFQFGNYSQIRLWLSINDLNIEQIELSGDYEINTYAIEDIKTNNKIKDRTFDYIPEEEMEIIDLR